MSRSTVISLAFTALEAVLMLVAGIWGLTSLVSSKISVCRVRLMVLGLVMAMHGLLKTDGQLSLRPVLGLHNSTMILILLVQIFRLVWVRKIIMVLLKERFLLFTRSGRFNVHYS